MERTHKRVIIIYREKNMATKVITSKLIECPHGFSTRVGGVSTGTYESLNLGMNRGDDKELVIKNWDIFLEACNISNREFVCGKQVHGNYVHIATSRDLRPAYGPGELIEADGYVTNEEHVPLAIFTADCTPLLLHDPVAKVVGAVHCGWRSTAADIMGNAVKAMIQLGSKPENIRAAIGPAICYDCFQVGEEVVEAMNELLGDASEYYRTDGDKYRLDLKNVVKARLIQVGVKPNYIDVSTECTLCQPTYYWSHRYKGIDRGSQANIIELI